MKRIACALLALGTCMAAGAAEWQASAGSTLRFAGTSQGERFEGGFGRFEAAIRFDPAAPAAARFEVRIDLASVDTANSERDEALRGPDFFAVEARPDAHYSAASVRAGDAPGRFVAEGELSLNGRTRAVPLQFTWSTTGEGAVLDGRATLDRLAFGLGEGDWADPDMIGREVTVLTRLLLVPAGG